MGVFGVFKTNSVVFTTEFVCDSAGQPAEHGTSLDFFRFPRGVRGCGGMIAVPVSNSVVKTTEFEECAAVWGVSRSQWGAGVFLDHALPRRMHGRSRGSQGCFSL